MTYASSSKALTEKIIDCIIQVHQELGPGFLENIYRNALLIELRRHGLRVEAEKEVPVRYRGVEVGKHRLDLLVEGRVVLELKSVDQLTGVHYAQLRSYLKATGCEVGLLVNFNDSRADFRRVELEG